MRNTVQMSSCAIAGALAIALGATACGPANGPDLLADSGSYKEQADAPARKASVQTARVNDAEARAASAEARARAAEARIQCEKERQEASNKGAVVGGVTGAVVGSQVAGDGAKSEGGAIGAVAGVLAGRQIAKKDHRC